MGAKFLSPSMSRLTLDPAPSVWNRSALETAAGSSHLGLSFAGAPSTIKAQVRWKVILADVARMLGGTEPMYACKERTDSMFRASVSFRLPLDTSGASFTDIVVVGTKCPTLCEAENEASAAALKELQLGHLRMTIMNVSLARCKELESRCYEILGNARELYVVLRSVILTWQEDLNKVEFCYASRERKLAESKCHAAETGYGDIDFEAAEQLAKMTSINYLKLTELTSEAEEVKDFIEGRHERIQYFFLEPAAQTAEDRGNLPQQIRLSMRLILQEILVFLAWSGPTFSIASPSAGLYVCQTAMHSYYGHTGRNPQTMTVSGPVASSEEEAVEASCKAAISFLETEKSVCVVDMNYNHRLHGGLYVVEAEEAMQFATLVSSKICSQWKAMVDEIHKCRERCHRLTVDYSNEEEAIALHKIKYDSIKAIGELHNVCLADLERAKHELKSAGASMVE